MRKTSYIFPGLLTSLLLTYIMKLWHADLSIPFNYQGDTLVTMAMIKGTIENGWFLNNINIGAPYGHQMFDYPIPNNLHFFIIKMISFLFPNYRQTLNVFYLLTFLTTILSSYFVMKKYIQSNFTAITGSILFTFLPYHFLRGEGHLFLADYSLIPFITLIVLWLFSETPNIFEKSVQKRYFGLNKRTLFCIIICILVSSTGVYYAFFACFFFAIAGISTAILYKSKKRFITMTLLVTVTVLGLLVNLLPNFIYHLNHGQNAEAVSRGSVGAEIYGFKLTQLLLPADNYRIAKIAELKWKYIDHTLSNNENTFSTLGAIGSLGFLTLIAILFFRKKSGLLYYLSLLNIAAILLATIGGFGSLISMFVTPDIRAYNRISVFIAFFSLLTIFFLSDQLYKNFAITRNTKLMYLGGMFIVLCFGLFDQTNQSYIPPYEINKAEFNNDQKFVESIESNIPKNSKIFQLPYVAYPESPGVNKMNDYELFKGYLHSKNLQWSYGAMKGREGDSWQKEVTSMPLEQFLSEISKKGFNGIYIDRFGYADGGVEIKNKLLALLKSKPLESDNKRLLFINMEDYNKITKGQ
ncbi:MAG: hypothetical protein JWM44_1256 [Bacilli bacterium]|nr:hypothetical protein [Bacilli bacterium]